MTPMIKDLKNQAKADRNLELYEDALEKLDEAIAELTALHGAADDPEVRRKAEAELADCYGMKGGVYRRWDRRLAEALKMYETGLEYEQRLGLDSYNFANVVSTRLILDGAALAEVQPLVRQGIELVERQVAQHRGEQWWAYADLGLFYLLAGDLAKARQQYKKFRDKGARAEDYDTTKEVLAELRESLRQAGSPVAELIDQATAFLTRERPES